MWLSSLRRMVVWVCWRPTSALGRAGSLSAILSANICRWFITMTHNLLIFPSTLPGQPLERYEAHGVTLDQWLRDNVTGYQPADQQPISATVYGVVVEPAQWAETYIT